jgi:hypothetical protein
MYINPHETLIYWKRTVVWMTHFSAILQQFTLRLYTRLNLLRELNVL